MGGGHVQDDGGVLSGGEGDGKGLMPMTRDLPPYATTRGLPVAVVTPITPRFAANST